MAKHRRKKVCPPGFHKRKRGTGRLCVRSK